MCIAIESEFFCSQVLIQHCIVISLRVHFTDFFLFKKLVLKVMTFRIKSLVSEMQEPLNQDSHGFLNYRFTLIDI